MADQPRKSLSVINPNDKVEQLRQAFAADPAARKLTDEAIIDKAVDPAHSPTPHLLEEKVIEALRTVFDPEIPVNVYDLGLIYGIQVDPENRVTVTMTLTAPGCPVAGDIVADVERKVEAIDEVKSGRVDLVFEPAWTKERMSEAALLELGLL